MQPTRQPPGPPAGVLRLVWWVYCATDPPTPRPTNWGVAVSLVGVYCAPCRLTRQLQWCSLPAPALLPARLTNNRPPAARLDQQQTAADLAAVTARQAADRDAPLHPGYKLHSPTELQITFQIFCLLSVHPMHRMFKKIANRVQSERHFFGTNGSSVQFVSIT